MVCPFISSKNTLKAKNLKHPVLLKLNPEFVGNDLEFTKQKILLLTGPNMGGKSTIMRTVCVNVILAQIGCYVLADSFEWSLVDKIFTRIGASDRLEQQKSTFYIEMEEMKTILENSTINTLAIVDELGRGTSTYDGYSIAVGCLQRLFEVNCKVMFATHYFFIQDDVSDFQEQLCYKKMDYILVDEKQEKILFQYKMVDGICHKSFAFNVARLAGIPEEIIQQARQITDKYRETRHI